MGGFGLVLAALLVTQSEPLADSGAAVLPAPLPPAATAPRVEPQNRPIGSGPESPRPKLRTIMPMQVPLPAITPTRLPFQGAGTPATVYRPLPFYHLGSYVSPFRPRIFQPTGGR